jgi:hypothetical protein
MWKVSGLSVSGIRIIPRDISTMRIFQNRALMKILGVRGTRYYENREDCIVRSVTNYNADERLVG